MNCTAREQVGFGKAKRLRESRGKIRPKQITWPRIPGNAAFLPRIRCQNHDQSICVSGIYVGLTAGDNDGLVDPWPS